MDRVRNRLNLFFMISLNLLFLGFTMYVRIRDRFIVRVKPKVEIICELCL
jgi:hypothetical protein